MGNIIFVKNRYHSG